jgi:hypothetical protein
MEALTAKFIAQTFSQARSPGTKIEFLEILADLAAKRPEVLEQSIVANVANAAACDPEKSVSDAAQKTLAALLAARPELGEAALKKVQAPSIQRYTDARLRALTVIAGACPALIEAPAMDLLRQQTRREELYLTIAALVTAKPELADPKLFVHLLDAAQESGKTYRTVAATALENAAKAQPVRARNALLSITVPQKQEELSAFYGAMAAFTGVSAELNKTALTNILSPSPAPENIEACEAREKALGALIARSPEAVDAAVVNVLLSDAFSAISAPGVQETEKAARENLQALITGGSEGAKLVLSAVAADWFDKARAERPLKLVGDILAQYPDLASSVEKQARKNPDLALRIVSAGLRKQP